MLAHRYTKVSTLAYVGTFYALAMSWPFTLLNCFLAAYSEGAQSTGPLHHVSFAVVPNSLSAELSLIMHAG